MNLGNLKKLFALLVLYRHNIHMLHWKVVGRDFDPTHTLLGDYESKLDDFIDEIAEMILTFGENPLTLSECMNLLSTANEHVLEIDSSKDYTSIEVYENICPMFGHLMKAYNDVVIPNGNCPSECTSKLDEHKYWLRIEGAYKNVKRLK